jgi:hypothetical protein
MLVITKGLKFITYEYHNRIILVGYVRKNLEKLNDVEDE